MRLDHERTSRKWSEPAPSPNLALFAATNPADVLVQYDALSEGHSMVKRQAYYLEQNEARIAAGKKPKLVGPSVANGNPWPTSGIGGGRLPSLLVMLARVFSINGVRMKGC